MFLKVDRSSDKLEIIPKNSLQRYFWLDKNIIFFRQLLLSRTLFFRSYLFVKKYLSSFWYLKSEDCRYISTSKLFARLIVMITWSLMASNRCTFDLEIDALGDLYIYIMRMFSSFYNTTNMAHRSKSIVCAITSTCSARKKINFQLRPLASILDMTLNHLMVRFQS